MGDACKRQSHFCLFNLALDVGSALWKPRGAAHPLPRTLSERPDTAAGEDPHPQPSVLSVVGPGATLVRHKLPVLLLLGSSTPPPLGGLWDRAAVEILQTSPKSRYFCSASDLCISAQNLGVIIEHLKKYINSSPDLSAVSAAFLLKEP